MKVFIWWEDGIIASVTVRQSLVVNKARKQGFTEVGSVEIWENEKYVGTFYNIEDLMKALTPEREDDEDD